ncbi:unnamed protein product [Prunus armeniaca]|uniref:MULE transposase domain-containing protein n=1 Tax=Prunus armeniaca TaxID=36596 RepID=A0A6J5TG58_PRUAR|nr:unnamed protein product [Prunus armeniaca]
MNLKIISRRISIILTSFNDAHKSYPTIREHTVLSDDIVNADNGGAKRGENDMHSSASTKLRTSFLARLKFNSKIYDTKRTCGFKLLIHSNRLLFAISKINISQIVGRFAVWAKIRGYRTTTTPRHEGFFGSDFKSLEDIEEADHINAKSWVASDGEEGGSTKRFTEYNPETDNHDSQFKLGGCKNGFKEGYMPLIGQKGLPGAFEDVVPNVEHRFCARHIFSNYIKLYEGKVLKDMYWGCARATVGEKYMR